VISPPLIMTKDQIKELVRVLGESISQAAAELT
jgi:adenosylmethionine-8-amino-7-oxononanoate aminotransferase